MPFPNEHASRQTNPDQYDDFRRTHPKSFPKGVDAIIGIKGDKSEIQSLRFDKTQWTPAQAKKWLKDKGFNTRLEVAAPTKKGLWTGVL